MARTVFLSFCSFAFVSGCEPTGVGDPCTPETVPDQGFLYNDVYVETSSLQCRTRVCMAFHSQTFCTRRCEDDADCLAEWHEHGPGQDGVEPAFCEAHYRVGARGDESYCVPSRALE